MQCYTHSETPAVAQCSLCSKGLCKECADKHKKIICQACATDQLNDIKAENKSRLKKIPFIQTILILFILLAIVPLGGLIRDWFVLGKFPHPSALILVFGIFGWPLVYYLKLLRRRDNSYAEDSTTTEIRELRNDLYARRPLGEAIFSWFFSFLFSIIIAGVASPLAVIYGIYKVFNLNKEKIAIKEFLDEHAEEKDPNAL